MVRDANPSQSSELAQFIVYACPVGALAKQLDRYFHASLNHCGANAAHRYMPHCTLTGFFHEVPSSVPLYVTALEQSLTHAQQHRPEPPILIKALAFNDDWHGLELASDWLKALVMDFSQRIESSTRPDAIRLKSWLHLSLAYGFDPAHAIPLKKLAETYVDIASEVTWELRYYQRFTAQEWDESRLVQRLDDVEVWEGDRWLCHHTWDL